MKTTDLRLAEATLRKNGSNLVFVKRGKVLFESKAHGITGFLLAIEELGKKLRESSVADRTVGRATGFLCVYSRVTSVFAVTASTEGLQLLCRNNISYEYENLVPNILNAERTDVCPFEKLTAGLVNPEEAYKRLKHEADSSSFKTF